MVLYDFVIVIKQRNNFFYLHVYILTNTSSKNIFIYKYIPQLQSVLTSYNLFSCQQKEKSKSESS